MRKVFTAQSAQARMQTSPRIRPEHRSKGPLLQLHQILEVESGMVDPFRVHRGGQLAFDALDRTGLVMVLSQKTRVPWQAV